MPTIKEIAEIAGVSRGTVDRVLNNRGSVNSSTEKKIRDIASALHYTPNRAGLVLAAQKKNLKLGFIVFGHTNPFFDKVLVGANEESEELKCYNCQVITRKAGVSAEEMMSAVNSLVEEGVNGLAIAPGNTDIMRSKIAELASKGIPVVTLNTDIENSERIAYVGSNYRESGRTAAGLVSLVTSLSPAPVHVGIIAGSDQILCHTERIAGFQARINEVYPKIQVSGIVYNHDDDIESYFETSTLLRTHPEINVLYFCAAGVYGGCRALTESGRQKEMRIITHDAVSTTEELLKRGIISATICQQPEKQGRLPLSILFSYLTTGARPDKDCYYVDTDIRIAENLPQ